MPRLSASSCVMISPTYSPMKSPLRAPLRLNVPHPATLLFPKPRCSVCLNNDWAIDAQNVGNKLRFANHSHTPNITPKVLTVNGDNRLAFYACKDIKPGEELFFNYNYKDEVAPDWHDNMNRKSDAPRKHKSAKKTSKC